ncbi:MAG: M16 family metallopeptidase [Pseudomonadota bacterium]
MNRVQIVALATCLLWSGLTQAVEIQHWTTDKGARVYFYPADNLPMVDVQVVFDAGSARDKRPGTAMLTNALLETGAGDMGVDEIAERLEAVGARLGQNAGRDRASLTLRSLSDERRLEKALAVMGTVLAEPTFPEEDFVRERGRLLQGLRQQRQQPSPQARKAFYETLYGEHPYAHATSGDEESVALLRRIHLHHFHRRYYVASNAVIALVGDLSRERAEALAEQLTEGLERGEPAPELPTVEAPSGERRDLEMDTQQSHILMGLPAVRRGQEDYFALYLGNHILGGNGFASRLMQRIREDRGLAYSVYSRLSPLRQTGPLTLGMQTRNEQREEAIELLRDNLKQFVEEGPTAEERQKALDNILGSEALRTDSNAELVAYLAMIGFYQLPLDHLEQFGQRVSEVSVEDIRRAWQKHIDLDRLSTIVVGAALKAEEDEPLPSAAEGAGGEIQRTAGEASD